MDTCELTRPLLLAAARGELRIDERHVLDRHLTACEGCVAELELLRVGWEALGSAAPVAAPALLRDTTLARVAALREREARSRPALAWAMRALIPAVVAAILSVGFVVIRDPGCRTPLALACCGALWAGAYATAFAVLVSSRRGAPGRSLAARGLLAAAGGLFLTGVCPNDAGQLAIPVFSGIAAAAASSTGMAFVLGLVLAGAPLLLATLALPARGSRPSAEFGASGIYFALLAPALYLQSNALALTGLFALVAGAAVGAVAPGLIKLPLRAAWAARGT